MPSGILAYNPTAGLFPSRILAERAANVLRAGGWKIYLEQTIDAEHITRIARQAADDKLDAFFMAGGDGSINRAVVGLVGSQTALGVLPAGTSNVFAQELGLPLLGWTRLTALEESARLLVDAQFCQVDTGLCNKQPFLMWAGMGLDAIIVHRIEPRSRWEKHFAVVFYTSTVVWYASYWRGMNLEVEVDGKKVRGHFLLALVSNVNLYAGGLLHLSPEARLDDGLMDLWLFEGDTLGDTVKLVLDIFAGRHVRSQKVMHIPFKNLSLMSDSAIYFQLDGEPEISTNPAQVSVIPLSLRVLVPKSKPNSRFVSNGER
ncbi:MAG: hypothetical protein A2W33_02435 [Chloroflexi bacterium RBG_16_52_11]|nr:MAG: hypothetical protein A2W33_02435 [Chloroflexi bacterium RBG_16_52_11]